MNNHNLNNFSMHDLFCMEVETQAAILNNNLLALETNANGSQELESLMRAVHSIKGAARIVQIDAAVKVAHVMEDCFVAAQKGIVALTADQIDILLLGVDMLLKIAQLADAELENWLAENNAEIERVVEAIATLCQPSVANSHKELKVSKFYVEGSNQPANVQPITSNPLPTTNSEQPAEEEFVAVQAALSVISHKPLPAPKQQLVPVQVTPQVPQTTERVVRVSADNLNRLMGLAGESLVEANWLQPFAGSLLKLKHRQTQLSNLLEKLQEVLADIPLNQSSQEHINAARQTASECRQLLADRLEELELFSRRSTNLSNRLYREVIASHMRPFADGVQGFPRMMRDLARQLGKQVKFEITGKSTKVDRDILEKLEAPLTHILRNAIDHGIELPQERLAAGKSAEGTVRLEAAHRAGMLSITVSDDGRGIDLELLRQKIVSRQLVNEEMAAQLSEAELMDFLFLPGFSTAKEVTEISGRGVGLDVVQSMVQQVGGALRTVSEPRKGMKFHLQLPLTLSVIRCLLVEIAGEPYAFPLTRIDRIVMVPTDAIALVENRQYFTLDEQNIGLVAAHQIWNLNPSPLNLDVLPTIVISDRLSRYGLVVDRCLGERDLVVRPLDSRLGKIPDISAAALMIDGSPILIVDIEDMVRSIDNLLASGQLKVKIGSKSALSYTTDGTPSKTHKRILVVDDSITVREVERKSLENKGYKVEVAVNGMDGWNAVRTGSYDLVISDIDMPRMNGIELVTQIRNHHTLKSIPVIIVSYKDREGDCIRGLEAGANYYLTKSSFHDDTLLKAVIDVIGEA